MPDLTLAACGLDCSECGHYILAMHHDLKTAGSLAEYFRDGWIGEYDGAEAVLAKVPICRGCWDNDVRTQYCADCAQRDCCEEKKLNNCGECAGFPCEKCVNVKAMELLASIHNAMFNKR